MNEKKIKCSECGSENTVYDSFVAFKLFFLCKDCKAIFQINKKWIH